MFKPINGWTKEKILSHFDSNFKEHSVLDVRCRYRDQKGNKCAVGVFITDDQYSEKLEDNNISRVFENFPSIKDSMPLELKALISLQLIHDDYFKYKGIDLKETLKNWIQKNVQD